MPEWRARFPGVSEVEWRDWRWQLRHMLRTEADLDRVVDLTPEERGAIAGTARHFRLGATPYYASLMDRRHPFCPVRMQVVPSPAEAHPAPGDLRDPLGEDERRPVRAVVHKYPDRALVIAADHCSTYCRHCTRRRITGGEEGAFDRAALEEAVAWVRAHREVRDVLVSGGEPLALADDRLEWLLGSLRAVPHVQILRVATRMPVTCPMRITPELARILRRMAPLFAVTHFNHPKECTGEAREACERLVDAGVPVENQTVLLRRLNSSARTIADLNQRLLAWRVRPYYLHQGDLAQGTAHLRTPLRAGVEILERLRGWTSGLAVPHLAVDLPGGGGKVTLQPDYLLGSGRPEGPPPPREATGPSRLPVAGHWLRDFRGEPRYYPEPLEADLFCPYDEVFYRAEG